MRYLLLFSLFLTCLASIRANGFDDDYINKIMSEASSTNEKLYDADIFPRNKFTCNTVSTNPRPTSVHALRPNDIEVIGAIGDSLTAANGAKANTIVGLLEECRGVSWSMGGEKPSINDLVTLPNILRQFNPNLFGFSTGSGSWTSSGAIFNLARPGETSFEMLDQAKNLVTRIRSANLADKWKLVTFFVGGNDLCKACKDTKYTSANYMNNIRQTLEYLKANLPKTLVNLVSSLDVTGIEELTGITCRNMQKSLCDCGLSATFRPTILGITKGIQQGVEDLVNSGIYDNSDDFTVVLQPFMRDMKPPRKADGSPDYTYFAPDCFHLSAKGHQAAAIELWKNMITPVGLKGTQWTHLNQPTIPCPNSLFPFIYTNRNSKSILRDMLAKQ